MNLHNGLTKNVNGKVDVPLTRCNVDDDATADVVIDVVFPGKALKGLI
jgi:hypothetical protein